MNSFQHKGEWWLPENPAHKVSGTLKYSSKDGPVLELIGSFKDHNQWLRDGSHGHIPIILGATTDAYRFTLCQCRDNGSHTCYGNGSPIIEATLIPFIAIQGWHFDRLEDIVCDNLGINYWYLDEWACMFRQGQFERPVKDENDGLKESISYTVSSPIVADLDSVKVVVKTLEHRRSDYGGCSVTITPYIVLEPKGPRTLMSLWENEQHHVNTFLMLAMGQTTYPQLVRANSPVAFRTLSLGTRYQEDLLMYMADQTAPDSALFRWGTLFSLVAILPDFCRYLRAWFEKASVMKPVFDLFFGTLTNTSLYMTNSFLGLSQALETYHRRTSHAGKYVSDEEWEKTKTVLVNAVPRSLSRDFRSSLTNKFNYLHEFSLRKRLRDVCEKCRTQAGVTVPDERAFVEDVASTRNYLTHYDARLEPQAKKGNALYVLIEQMRCLLEVLFLTEIGMDRTTIQRIARDNRRFEHYMAIVRE